MSTRLRISLLAAVLGLGAASAQAGFGFGFSFNRGYCGPVYPPVVAPCPPVYCPPPVVYSSYYAPPVYYSAPVVRTRYVQTYYAPRPVHTRVIYRR